MNGQSLNTSNWYSISYGIGKENNYITGRGAPRVGRYLKQDGHGAPRLGMYEPPPFIGTWEQMRGRGKKKNEPYCKTQIPKEYPNE